MLINTQTAISTSTVLLAPYSRRHVPKYNEWMKDEEIQEATASEPLSLQEEYAMQQSWRDDADKLSFIICHPLTGKPAAVGAEDDAPDRMIGDINLFLCVEDSEETPQIIGEVELMIPEKKNQRRGFGRAALLAFMRYLVDHGSEILGEFVEKDPSASRLGNPKFGCLCVKIGEGNTGSLALFESLLFERVSGPNYFGEIELRRVDLRREVVHRGLGDYVELEYGGE